MGTIEVLLLGFFAFIQNLSGIIFKPYVTYRRIIEHGNVYELPYIAVLLGLYFALASLVKTAAFRPFLLTKEFMLLGSGAGLSYLVMVAVLWQAARIVGGTGALRNFAVGWAYTLIPTLIWFLTTSILYVLLPPPRTTAPLGIIFSVVYLIFCVTLFFWKLILGYLTLRFGMRLDLGKIGLVMLIVGPFIALYSVFMYRMNIFRVPFI